MKFITTREPYWIKEWDNYVYHNPKGSHLSYSDWLKTYESYGFDFEVGIVINIDEEIIGGFGAVIAKVSFFKFYIIPHGPIITNLANDVLNLLFDQMVKRAKFYRCCALQISIPFSKNKKISSFIYSSESFNEVLEPFKIGKCFEFIYCNYGLNWVDLEGFQNENEFMNKLTPQVRRNIRISLKSNLSSTTTKSSQEIDLAYQIIEKNASEGRYKVREWNKFDSYIKELIAKNLLTCQLAYINNQPKGSSLIFKNKFYDTYAMGGTIKEKPDLKTGYFLHWQIIKSSINNNLKGYNISMGGSDGVQNFKKKFNSEVIYFEEPHRYIVFQPIIFKLYLYLSIYIKPLKKYISKWL